MLNLVVGVELCAMLQQHLASGPMAGACTLCTGQQTNRAGLELGLVQVTDTIQQAA